MNSGLFSGGLRGEMARERFRHVQKRREEQYFHAKMAGLNVNPGFVGNFATINSMTNENGSIPNGINMKFSGKIFGMDVQCGLNLDFSREFNDVTGLTKSICVKEQNAENESLEQFKKHFDFKLCRLLYDDYKKMSDDDIVKHYAKHGCNEKRIIYFNCDWFDVKIYKYINDDLNDMSDDEALKHYILIGHQKNYPTMLPKKFDPNIYKIFCEENICRKDIIKQCLNNNNVPQHSLFNFAKFIVPIAVISFIKRASELSPLELSYHYAQFGRKKKIICDKISALKENGRLLKFIPENERNEELCGIAFQETTDAIIYIPEHLRTFQLCKRAIENYINRDKTKICLYYNDLQKEYISKHIFNWNLDNLKKEKRNIKLCKLKIFFPNNEEHYIYFEKIFEKIIRNIFMIHHSDEIIISDDVCQDELYCVEFDPHVDCIHYINYTKFSKNEIEDLLNLDGAILNLIQPEKRSFDMIKKSIKKNSFSATYINFEKLLHSEIIELLKVNSFIFEYIPKNLHTLDMMKIAIIDNYTNAKFINFEKLNVDNIRDLLRIKPTIRVFIPEKIKF